MKNNNKDNGLINELEENRRELHKMIESIQLLRDTTIEKLSGNRDGKINFRDKSSYSKLSGKTLDDFLKIITSFLSTELDARKQIDSSIERQVNISKKLTSDDSGAIQLSHTDLLATMKYLEGKGIKVNNINISESNEGNINE